MPIHNAHLYVLPKSLPWHLFTVSTNVASVHACPPAYMDPEDNKTPRSDDDTPVTSDPLSWQEA